MSAFEGLQVPGVVVGVEKQLEVPAQLLVSVVAVALDCGVLDGAPINGSAGITAIGSSRSTALGESWRAKGSPYEDASLGVPAQGRCSGFSRPRAAIALGRMTAICFPRGQDQ